MVRQIKKLVQIQLTNFWKINEIRFGKDKQKKKRIIYLMLLRIFLGIMFPRKTFFPVVLLNMVGREVKPVEGIKFCSSFLCGQLKASVNEKIPLTEGAYSF